MVDGTVWYIVNSLMMLSVPLVSDYKGYLRVRIGRLSEIHNSEEYPTTSIFVKVAILNFSIHYYTPYHYYIHHMHYFNSTE